jgi:hypothetical protein
MVLLLALPVLLAPPPVPPPGIGPRILQPFARLLAELQWLRFQRASLGGENVRALDLAGSALTLDPKDSAGWQTLGTHLVLYLASPEREPELELRRRWLAAGREVFRRGAAEAEDPGSLELALGLVLLVKAEIDPDVHEGGAPALYLEAAEAFERAVALGSESAAGLADYARGLGRP